MQETTPETAAFVDCALPLRDLPLPPPGAADLWFLDLARLGNPLDPGRSLQPGSLRVTHQRTLRRFYLRLLLGAYFGLPGKDVHVSRPARRTGLVTREPQRCARILTEHGPRALQAGADGYLVKDSAVEELAAALDAVLRRGTPGEVYNIGGSRHSNCSMMEAIRKGKVEVYTPWIWRWIMLAVRNVPTFIFKKMKF